MKNSLGLVVFQLMSKEDLPVSGDRWRELRHGGVSGRTAQQFINYLAGTQTETNE